MSNESVAAHGSYHDPCSAPAWLMRGGLCAVFADYGLIGDSEVSFDSLFDHARFGGVGEAAEELDALAVGEGGEEIVG